MTNIHYDGILPCTNKFHIIHSQATLILVLLFAPCTTVHVIDTTLYFQFLPTALFMEGSDVHLQTKYKSCSLVYEWSFILGCNPSNYTCNYGSLSTMWRLYIQIFCAVNLKPLFYLNSVRPLKAILVCLSLHISKRSDDFTLYTAYGTLRSGNLKILSTFLWVCMVSTSKLFSKNILETCKILLIV